jgi:hypothetical protein
MAREMASIEFAYRDDRPKPSKNRKIIPVDDKGKGIFVSNN